MSPQLATSINKIQTDCRLICSQCKIKKASSRYNNLMPQLNETVNKLAYTVRTILCSLAIRRIFKMA